ncbi:MAG: hypothetical protein E7485_10085 [Ruminococcaceae bacterium]|nr:hypothetical protein [Oscillospiraceae bacterium]
MDEIELREKIARIDERSKSNTHRLDTAEKKLEESEKLLNTIALVAQRQSDMDGDIKEIKTEVKTLTSKAGKRWDSVVEKIIIMVVAAVVTYALTKFGLGI